MLCFVLHQIVGLKTHGYDRKSLALLCVGLKTLLSTASDAYSEHWKTSEKEFLPKSQRLKEAITLAKNDIDGINFSQCNSFL